ncbi:hypothetical protein KOI35_25135 [Actinoplanes bogorensis]|uniref:Uncharacterized protein n=1 Tax=Paractinoplanes bogorensis TaxID=1610840 RepID=A0ABS5YVQ7_9ACTN|nr:hypothetical protein [Actinoplanes bogorensis]MBU2666799.1 hypothetical protein [Actinoplanes bogorensis]
MGKEMVSAAGGQNFQIIVPDSLPAAVLQSVILPTVLAGAEALAGLAHGVKRVLVKVDHENRTRIEYLNAYHEVVRNEIVPVLAMANAFQHARNAARSSGLDSDLQSDLLADLEVKRAHRRAAL